MHYYCFSIIYYRFIITKYSTIKTRTKKTDKGLKAFNALYIFGFIFAGAKLIDYLQWTFTLVKNWSLPGEPFFSKVNLLNSDAQISVTVYLIFAIAYIIVFGFIILGLYQLNRTTKLFAGEKIFQQEVGSSFKIAGRSFLAYAFGTLIIDIAFLAWANTSNLLSELLSTELLVFLILGYLMLFLADVFKRGIIPQEENELTI